MRKKLKWIAVAVVALLIVGVGIVWWNLNSIVRVAVERGTGRSLALETKLGKANVQLLSGDVALGNLTVGNPAGFDEPQLLSLGGVSVDTSYGKVFGDPVAINDIKIDKPKLTIEFKGTKSNVKAVADNLMQTQKGDPAPNPSPEPPPSPEPKTDPQPGDANKPIKLIIDQLAVTGAQVEIVSDMLKIRQTIDVPAISLQAIGNADGNRNGEEIGKVVSHVITALSIEAQKSGKLPPELAQILNGDLDQLINQIGGKFQEQAQALKAQAMKQLEDVQKQATEQIGNVQKQAQQQLEDAQKKASDEIQKGLGGILGGDKTSEKPSEKK